ncbi:uncharacterized protein IWZ02DRAFT_290520 [Phyllosticta citriasiana]|uniref:uncharacterized protein n=1 Tax=Phyllosticta citriasiana TaxID=595635 RepID=UPI0030FD9B50
MLLGLLQPLLILLPSFAWAYPRASSTSALAISTSFPSYLQADVPDCAQPCLQTILRDEYPTTCSSAADIACYCTQYSSSGLSLGEAAYECAVASCTSAKNLASSYSICDGIAAAVAPTHTILFFTAQITSTASRATRTGSLSTPTVAHNSTVRSTSTPAANSTSHASTLSTKQTPSSTSAHASSTIVPLTTATAANSNNTASYEKGGLSNSQVAGITVGGVAGAALLVGAVFFLAWLRKRHRRKNDDVLEKRDRDIWSVTPPADQGPDHLEPSDLAALGSLPRDPNANRGPAKDAKDPRSGGQVGVSLPQTTVDRGWTIRLRTPSPPADQIGLAISQDPVAVDAALGSAASERTVSQLLPEKPEPAHHATGSGSDMDRMVQPSAAVVAVRPQLCRESSQTVFEEDSGRQWGRESVPSRNPPQLAPPMAVHHRPQFAEDYVQSPEALQATGMPTMAPPAPNHHRSTWPSPPPIPSPLRIQTSPTATAMITDRPVQDPSTFHAAVNPYVRVTQASSSSGGTTMISSSGSVSHGQRVPHRHPHRRQRRPASPRRLSFSNTHHPATNSYLESPCPSADAPRRHLSLQLSLRLQMTCRRPRNRRLQKNNSHPLNPIQPQAARHPLPLPPRSLRTTRRPFPISATPKCPAQAIKPCRVASTTLPTLHLLPNRHRLPSRPLVAARHRARVRRRRHRRTRGRQDRHPTQLTRPKRSLHAG